MPFCPKCGTRQEEKAKFCNKCGSQLRNMAVEEAAASRSISVSQPVEIKKGRNGKIILLTVVLLLLISLSVAGWFSLWSKNGLLVIKKEAERHVPNNPVLAEISQAIDRSGSKSPEEVIVTLKDWGKARNLEVKEGSDGKTVDFKGSENNILVVRLGGKDEMLLVGLDEKGDSVPQYPHMLVWWEKTWWGKKICFYQELGPANSINTEEKWPYPFPEMALSTKEKTPWLGLVYDGAYGSAGEYNNTFYLYQYDEKKYQWDPLPAFPNGMSSLEGQDSQYDDVKKVIPTGSFKSIISFPGNDLSEIKETVYVWMPDESHVQAWNNYVERVWKREGNRFLPQSLSPVMQGDPRREVLRVAVQYIAERYNVQVQPEAPYGNPEIGQFGAFIREIDNNRAIVLIGTPASEALMELEEKHLPGGLWEVASEKDLRSEY